MGSKRNVTTAHAILESAAAEGRLDARFFSIVDRDFDPEIALEKNRQFSWDRYHIENYLLEPRFIKKTLFEISAGTINLSELDVYERLKVAAEQTIKDLTRVKLQSKLNASLVRTLSLNYDRGISSAAEGFSQAIANSLEKITRAAEGFNVASLREMEDEEISKLRSSLDGDQWFLDFPGRQVLKKFVDNQGGVVRYDQLRNLIIARMREDEFQPSGMKRVVDQILSA